MNFAKRTFRHTATIGCSLLWAMLSLLPRPTSADDRKPQQSVSFERDVAPLFEQKCISCHNAIDRQGDFSLQSKSAAFADGYISAGQPGKSHLLDLLVAAGDMKRPQMPKDGPPLTQREVQRLRRWISEGANWPDDVQLQPARVTRYDWWSWQPVTRPLLPQFNQPWIENPIDRFVFSQLQKQGLKPSPRADRRTLIRRVSYDLLGLPPSPAEVTAFVNDRDPLAWERLIDRLLASPQYGERWARHWLDIVKYADTCGYDKDKLRPHAWPYRDYVIRSFNRDKPWSRFIREQVAGDVLFPGDPEGILALGFLAAGPWDFIGHVEVPESKIDGKVARNLDRDDMVSNTINSFCSVTIQCARCHHHKFDPLTQQNYYSLQAVFAALDRADRDYGIDKKTESQRQRLIQQLATIEAERKKLVQTIDAEGGAKLAQLTTEIAKLTRKLTVEKSSAYGFHSQIVSQPHSAKWVQIDLGKLTEVDRVVLYPCHDEYAGIGAGFGFPVRYKMEVSQDQQRWKTVVDRSRDDQPNPGLAEVTFPLDQTRFRFLRLTVVKLAERKNDFMFALAEIDVRNPEGQSQTQKARVTFSDSIEAPPRWTNKNLVDGRWPRWKEQTLATQLLEKRKQRQRLNRTLWTESRRQRFSELQTSQQELRNRLAALPSGRKVYAAATHFTPQGQFRPTGGTPRAIHVLHRGNVTQPQQRVGPGVFPLSPGDDWKFSTDTNEAASRAALADWLTRKKHPLTWRSIVNRVWQYHFGQGLVATPNDFGRMGALPTHPKLLDWLACEFRDNGQSLKHLHRLILTSATYQQTSAHRPEAAAVDSSNRWLWRVNRRRLTAEEIRDSILDVSGALKTQAGGPGYYLFELERTAHSPHYEYHKFNPADETTHRRSIYRFVVRSQPDPWMSSLDCADSSQSTPRRNETLTPLQALTLFNNDFNLEMSRRFADRLRQMHPQLEGQVRQAWWLVTQRKPDTQEFQQLLSYTHMHGLENTCRILINLNEFVFVD